MSWKQISDPGDYDHVEVWGWTTKPQHNRYEICVVRFTNREYTFGAVQGVKEVLLWPGLALAIILTFASAAYSTEPYDWAVMAGIIWVCFFALLHWVDAPKRVKRRIEVDFRDKMLRVYRKNKVEIEEKLPVSSPGQLPLRMTIEEHPAAAYKRQMRQEQAAKGIKTGQSLSNEEKSMCLFGWFGSRGTRKKLLLTRATFGPDMDNALSEVQDGVYQALSYMAATALPAQGRNRRHRNP